MIDKLRKKIFWIIQISLSVIIIGIIILFTTFSYRNTIMSSTMFMDRLEGRMENKEDRLREFSEEKNERYIEGVYKIDVNNNNAISKSTNITDEIRNYAIEVSKRNVDEGYIGNYIYKVRKIGINGKEVTLIESENTIKELKTTIIIAIVVGVLGLITIYIIAKKISKTIVKPVADSFEKQKQFVSDASHELKTPLAVIEANADVLQDKVGENKWITYIQNEVQSMNKLVNDLLVLARMENTNTTNNKKFNLSKEVQMSVSVFESIIYEKKIKLETNINDGIEFNGEKEDIKHIISILLDNAIKHTKENGKIIVNTIKEKNDIKIEVKNQGEPIPEEERKKIFERFYRVDKARNRNEKRYGLGLSIAKGIVEKYKGTIEANSKDGFTIFIVKI
ncbi:MAG: HAMP domain-containing sensor histidine kinase [Clostridia bacterium]|nr:HAMP domain-containing sensor histidine kinase [Clostridia bacterium]